MFKLLLVYLGLGATLIVCSNSSLALEGRILPNEWLGTPTWSPTGTRIAVSYVKNGRKIVKDKEGKTCVQYDLNYFRNRKTVLLNSSTYELLQEFKGDYYSHAFSNDGQFLMGYDSGKAKVFNVNTGQCVLSIGDTNPHGFYTKLDFEGKRVAAFSSDKPKIFFLDKTPPVVLPGNFKVCDQFSWSPDGVHLAARCYKTDYPPRGCSLVIWNTTSGKIVMEKLFSSGVFDISWSPNGKWFSFADGKLHLMNSKLDRKLKIFENATRFEWSNNSKKIAFEGKLGKIQIVDPANGKVLARIQSEKFGNSKFQWWKNDKYLVINDLGSTIAIFDGESGKLLGSCLNKRFDNLVCSPNSNSLILVNRFIAYPIEFLSARLPKRNSETQVFENGTNSNPWTDQVVPKNLTEAIEELKRILGKNLSKFKNTKERELYIYTSSMGMGIPLRNSWRLWGGSPIAEYFQKRGLKDGTDISTIIIESTWRDLNKIKVDPEKQIADCIKINSLKKSIVVENRRLPPSIVNSAFKTYSGSKKIIGNMNSTIKIITYIEAVNSKKLIEKLKELSAQFRRDQLQIMVIVNKKTDQKKYINSTQKREILEFLSKLDCSDLAICSTTTVKKAFESFIMEPYPKSYKARYKEYIPVEYNFLIVDKKNVVKKRIRPSSNLDSTMKLIKSQLDLIFSNHKSNKSN